MEDKVSQIKKLNQKVAFYKEKLNRTAAAIGRLVLEQGLALSGLDDQFSEYRRLIREKTNLERVIEELVKTIETEQYCKQKLREEKRRSRLYEEELKKVSRGIGNYLLESQLTFEGLGIYLRQYEDLVRKINEIEDHLSLLTQEGTKDFFSFIGNKSRKLLLVANRAGKMKERDRIFIEAGHWYLKTPIGIEQEAAEFQELVRRGQDLVAKLDESKKHCEHLDAEIAQVRSYYNQKGIGPIPSIDLKKLQLNHGKICHELEDLFKTMGKRVVQQKDAPDLLSVELASLIQEYRLDEEAVQSLARSIEKVSAEQQIEELEKELAKLYTSVAAHKETIIQTEHLIEEKEAEVQRLRQVLS
ncbi:MAG: hypothetical protein SNJ56_01565 [Termitinemataceae bacterium]